MAAKPGRVARIATTEQLDKRIAAAERKIADLDARIGALMTRRADAEDAIAPLYEMRNRLRALQGVS